jgi:hypothetical protein
MEPNYSLSYSLTTILNHTNAICTLLPHLLNVLSNPLNHRVWRDTNSRITSITSDYIAWQPLPLVPQPHYSYYVADRQVHNYDWISTMTKTHAISRTVPTCDICLVSLTLLAFEVGGFEKSTLLRHLYLQQKTSYSAHKLCVSCGSL